MILTQFSVGARVLILLLGLGLFYKLNVLLKVTPLPTIRNATYSRTFSEATDVPLRNKTRNFITASSQAYEEKKKAQLSYTYTGQNKEFYQDYIKGTTWDSTLNLNEYQISIPFGASCLIWSLNQF